MQSEKPFKSGEQISLFPIRNSNIGVIQALHNIEEIRKELDCTIPQTKDEIKSDLIQSEKIVFMVYHQSESDEIGYVELKPKRSHSMKINTYIIPEKQGNRYGTEATELALDYVFNEVGIERVEARIHHENTIAKQMLENLGFKHEGTLQKSKFFNGKYTNEKLLAVLRENYKGYQSDAP